MADIRPIQQPPQPAREDLANALLIAEAWGNPVLSDKDTRGAFDSVARLIRAALDKLGEPSPAAIRAAQVWLTRAVTGSAFEQNDADREASDCAAAILHAALSGEPLGAPQEPTQ